MEHGLMVVLHNPPLWRDLRVRTMKEYGDGAHWRERYRQALKRRLQMGTAP